MIQYFGLREECSGVGMLDAGINIWEWRIDQMASIEEVQWDLPQDETIVTPAMAELIKALDGAGREKGSGGVYLDWFREWYVVGDGHDSPSLSEEREETLRKAVKEGIILAKNAPNPLSPASEVTVIRLNKSHPGVEKALWDPSWGDDDFEPIAIRGEQISETIIRQRRGE